MPSSAGASWSPLYTTVILDRHQTERMEAIWAAQHGPARRQSSRSEAIRHFIAEYVRQHDEQQEKDNRDEDVAA